MLQATSRAWLRHVFCGFLLLVTAQVQAGDIDLHAVRAASQHPVEQLERIYLHELSAAVLAAAQRYAQVGGVPVPHDIERLARFEHCRYLLPTLRAQVQQLRQEAVTINPAAYFEHVLVLSLTLAHLNRKLSELGVERAVLKKNFMEGVLHHKDSRNKLAEFDQKIATLQASVNTIFSSDTANTLLLAMLPDPASGKRQPLYKMIVSDYYRARGNNTLATVQQHNQARVQQAATQALQRSAALLNKAWQHTCTPRRLAWLRGKPERLLFYFKHRALTQHVTALLDEADVPELTKLHTKLLTAAQDKLKPSQYSTSPRSFFGLLGILTVPAFFVAHKHNKFTLPLMAATGLTVTWRKTRALQRVREQLHTGVGNGLNSYADYRGFKNSTSLSRYAFSHISATALAMVLRKIPRSPDGKFMNVDAKFLGFANAFGSLASMFAIETLQTKNFNFLKDRESFYNIVALLMVDFALAYISALNLSDEVRIALISSSTMLLAVVGHIISGKEINWDRIVYDTTFISTFSLYKSVYFYTNGSRALIKNYNINTRGGQTALMSGMALLSNALGNVPYATISRHWIEKKPPPNMFTPQNDAQEFDDIAQIIAYLSHKHGIDATELEVLQSIQK